MFRRNPRRLALLLSLVAFFVYNANLREVSSYDTMSTRYLPLSVLQEGDLDLDEFEFFFKPGVPTNPVKKAGGAIPDRTPYWVQFSESTQRYVSTFPVVAALLATPIYALPVALGLGDDPGRAQLIGTLLGKLSGAAFAAGSLALLFLMLLRLTTFRYALLSTLVYGFATSTWSVASQSLWQISSSEPSLILALYGFVRARQPGERAQLWYAIAGLGLALAVGSRPPDALPAVLMTAFVLHSARRQLGWFLLAPAVVAVGLLAYNIHFFGHPIGGYIATNVEGTLRAPSLAALGGLLISPSRGLFVLSPVLCFALIGLWHNLKQDADGFWRSTALSAASVVAFYSCWRYWHGHHAWGYRHLIDVLPFLILHLPRGLEWTFERSWARPVFYSAAVFSVAFQITGAFFFPCGWDGSPKNAFEHQERLWDLSDTQFVRCATSSPIYPHGLKWVTGQWDRKRF